MKKDTEILQNKLFFVDFEERTLEYWGTALLIALDAQAVKQRD